MNIGRGLTRQFSMAGGVQQDRNLYYKGEVIRRHENGADIKLR